jgi:hypothetical protein
MKGKKIVVVGLPLFAKRFVEQMTTFDTNNTYIHLNTYYNKKDQLRFLFHLKNLDVLYSINGTLDESKVITKVLDKGKPVILNWAGSDVLNAIEAYKSNNYNERFHKECVHHAVAPWLAEELKEINIDAKYLPYLGFDSEKTQDAKSEENGTRLKVITYINEQNPSFYGLEKVQQIAQECPDIEFGIVGMQSEENSLSNVKFYGWVDDLRTLMNEYDVIIRQTEHDGLSNFILDGLSLGKTVIYNKAFPHCTFADNIPDCVRELTQLNVADLKNNIKGIDFINNEFNKEKVLGNVKKEFEKIIG